MVSCGLSDHQNLADLIGEGRIVAMTLLYPLPLVSLIRPVSPCHHIAVVVIHRLTTRRPAEPAEIRLASEPEATHPEPCQDGSGELTSGERFE
jgi:hypothetical protein